MLPALALVPPCHVKASFELVVEEIAEVIDKETFDETISEKVDELALYCKNTYIEGPRSRKRHLFQYSYGTSSRPLAKEWQGHLTA